MIAHADVVSAVALLLEQSDIADLAIEDLRKWGCWGMTDAILDLYDKKSHDVPIIRRAILRYALSCPKQGTKADAFVKAERKRDKEYVEDVEELLKLETEPPPK